MKRLITLLIATFSVAALYASEPTTVYCSISGGHLASISNGYIGQVNVNFGQKHSAKDYLVDNNGKRLNFDTMIAALNYMSKAGWQLESTYTQFEPSLIEDSGLDECTIIMILSKRITADEQITEGILTRKMFENPGQPIYK